MKFYATVAASSDIPEGSITVERIEQRVLDSNPVMEAFGKYDLFNKQNVCSSTGVPNPQAEACSELGRISSACPLFTQNHPSSPPTGLPSRQGWGPML